MIEQAKATPKDNMNHERRFNRRGKKYESKMLNENKINTFSIYEQFEEDDTLFFTSTPKKPRFFCGEYWKRPYKDAGS